MILKLTSSLLAAILLLPTVDSDRQKLAKYRSVEAYEVRPGILMMPRYSADGQLCEIVIEGMHYTPELVRLDPSLSRKEIDQVFDEIVPNSERGPRPENILERGMTIESGMSMTTYEEYGNVSIQIYGGASSAGQKNVTVEEVVATLKWKNRKC